eukprot:4846048-Amphidinium_carterae.1
MAEGFSKHFESNRATQVLTKAGDKNGNKLKARVSLAAEASPCAQATEGKTSVDNAIEVLKEYYNTEFLQKFSPWTSKHSTPKAEHCENPRLGQTPEPSNFKKVSKSRGFRKPNKRIVVKARSATYHFA